jgi:hypothetical protein
MAEIRSEILNTGHPKVKAAQIDINGRPSEVFELLIDPTKHPLIDGSNSVKSVNWGPEKLTLGSKFGMRMKIGIPYRITNYVTEFDQNKLISWRHLGKWVWRYELTDLGNDKTRVVESFDGRPSPYQWWLRRRNAYKYVEKAIAKSLVRLKRLVEEKG